MMPFFPTRRSEGGIGTAGMRSKTNPSTHEQTHIQSEDGRAAACDGTWVMPGSARAKVKDTRT